MKRAAKAKRAKAVPLKVKERQSWKSKVREAISTEPEWWKQRWSDVKPQVIAVLGLDAKDKLATRAY